MFDWTVCQEMARYSLLIAEHDACLMAGQAPLVTVEVGFNLFAVLE